MVLGKAILCSSFWVICQSPLPEDTIADPKRRSCLEASQQRFRGFWGLGCRGLGLRGFGVSLRFRGLGV